MWSQAGHVARFESGGIWYAALSKTEWPKDTETLENLRQSWDEIYGDRGHELVFIAQNLRKKKLLKNFLSVF